MSGHSWAAVVAELLRRARELGPPYARARELPTRNAAQASRNAGNEIEKNDIATVAPVTRAGRATEPARPAGGDNPPPTPSDPRARVLLDLSSDHYTAELAAAPIYRKKGLVRADIAHGGEVIRTTLADGTVETTNLARTGQVIITNPGGEQYIYKGGEADIDTARADFDKRHEGTDEPGVYRPKGKIRAIPNDTGHPIEIMAPWGEPQYADIDGKIGVGFDPEKPDEISLDRYLLGGTEFSDTYELDT